VRFESDAKNGLYLLHRGHIVLGSKQPVLPRLVFLLCFAPLIMRSDEGSLVGVGIFLFNIYFFKIFFEK
jgi:hypothetical protein